MIILCFLISFLKPNRYCVFRQSNDTSRSACAHRIIRSSRASRLPTYLLSVRIGDVIISGTHTQTVSHFIWLPSFEGVLWGAAFSLPFVLTSKPSGHGLVFHRRCGKRGLEHKASHQSKPSGRSMVGDRPVPVSYTHLTLPTKRIV